MGTPRNLSDDSTLAYLFGKQKEDLLREIALLIYPVGSIYVSSEPTDPSKLFGGTWVQIKDRFLLTAGDTYQAGATGGKANYVADDMPKHSHTRGTMEIKGTMSHNNTYSGSPYHSASFSGAFGAKSFSGTNYYLSGRSAGGGWCDADFAASRSWTGATSESGANTTATIMPPYRVVYAWERTA